MNLFQPNKFHSIKTCIIHGDSLLTNNNVNHFCFLCNKVLQKNDILIKDIYQCQWCHRFYLLHGSCSICFQCNKCYRYTRLPGFCLFDCLIFNPPILHFIYKQEPLWIVCFLLNSSFDFITKNAKWKCDGILQIILDYL